ncbi:MAG: hypothetical protein IPK03_03235 [Bacteroidetes bacterium]|nr:hypothetical protein [Bacteroidota bacterium]
MRTTAYQMNIVMKYLDNLIEWGDYLYTTDTRENINQAAQLYIMAQDLLGPKAQGTCQPISECKDI